MALDVSPYVFGDPTKLAVMEVGSGGCPLQISKQPLLIEGFDFPVSIAYVGGPGTLDRGEAVSANRASTASSDAHALLARALRPSLENLGSGLVPVVGEAAKAVHKSSVASPRSGAEVRIS
jgi:hypothetical protein